MLLWLRLDTAIFHSFVVLFKTKTKSTSVPHVKIGQCYYFARRNFQGKLPLWVHLCSQNQHFWELKTVKMQILVKFGDHFPSFMQSLQQKVKNITTIIFTNFGQVLLVNLLVLSKLQILLRLLFCFEQNTIATKMDFEQVKR